MYKVKFLFRETTSKSEYALKQELSELFNADFEENKYKEFEMILRIGNTLLSKVVFDYPVIPTTGMVVILKDFIEHIDLSVLSEYIKHYFLRESDFDYIKENYYDDSFSISEVMYCYDHILVFLDDTVQSRILLTDYK